MSSQFGTGSGPTHPTDHPSANGSMLVNCCCVSCPLNSRSDRTTRGLSRRIAATHSALRRSIYAARGSSAGTQVSRCPSRWLDTRPRSSAMRCAAMSFTVHEPAMVGRDQSSAGSDSRRTRSASRSAGKRSSTRTGSGIRSIAPEPTACRLPQRTRMSLDVAIGGCANPPGPGPPGAAPQQGGRAAQTPPPARASVRSWPGRAVRRVADRRGAR